MMWTLCCKRTMNMTPTYILQLTKRFSRVNIDPTLLAACSIVLAFLCLGIVLGYFAAYQHLLPVYGHRIAGLERAVDVINRTQAKLVEEVYRGE